ncbi:MAG: hypothetical protein K6G17_08325 [Oscillospiraceae bacterium]|nr:hypothetical protein [Oscillospiraceae bacterium]
MLKIREKWRSRRGASITYALLLFLVCAVVGVVVLVAGAGAGGRLSGLAAADQRYYSVSSAAQLFRSQIEGEKQTVTREKTTESKVETVYTADAEGAVTAGTPTETVEGTTVVSKLNGTDIDSSAGLLKPFALKLVFGDAASYQSAEAWSKTAPALGGDWTCPLTLSYSEGGAENEAMKVQVSAAMKTDGSIVLVFSNDTASGGEPYRLQMTLGVEIKNRSARSETNGDPVMTPVDGSPGSYTETVTSTVVETKITEITWKVTEVKVLEGVSAP